MTRKSVALVLVVLGVLGLVAGLVGFNQKTAILEVGGITASATEHKTSPVLAVVGGIFLVGGVVLLMSDRKQP